MPLHAHILFPTHHKSAEIHICLDHGEYALGLNGTVDTKQDPFLCGNLLFHPLALLREVFGHIQSFYPVFQWRLIRLFLTDTLLLDRTALAVTAFINRIQAGNHGL